MEIIKLSEDFNPSAFKGGIKRALEYLNSRDFSSIKDGEYPIEEKKIYAKVFSTETKKKSEAKAEFHELYYDLQYWQEGCEMMGYSENQNYNFYKADDDLFFIDDESLDKDIKYIHFTKGSVAIIPPLEVHQPQVAVNDEIKTIRKVVVKVHKDTI